MKNLSSLLIGSLLIAAGIKVILEQEVTYWGSYVSGNKAIGFGTIVLLIGTYFLYLFFKGLKSNNKK